MVDFSITASASDDFNVCLAGRDVAMPLRLDPENVGVILDDDGRDVITIDSNGDRDDDEADEIARIVMLALNKLGGF